MFGTCLSGYILERDAKVSSLFVHLSLRLSDVEDTAANTSTHTGTAKHEVEKENYHGDGKEQVQNIPQIIALLVVISKVARELSFFLLFGDKTLHLIHAADFYGDKRFRTCLLRTLTKHIADVFGLDEHLHLAFGLVHDDFRSKALFYINLELLVRCGSTGTARDAVASHEINGHQTYKHEDINPSHVEARHLRRVIVLVF